ASYLGDPAQLTAKQMDAWAGDFDSWAICDTVCFHLFDRTALAWPRVHAWASARAELKKRAAFALLWGLTVHDKSADDAQFLKCLPLIERAAEDERDYVKKGVDMALRALGKRNPQLGAAVVELARRMSESDSASQAGIGRSALRELAKRR
ncbi:MAG TPA: DNA alkylation repair protein, partial [Polyangiales bacterium]|nr:DNA alkylation repair protein [Polyangiales bacterium]